MRLFVDDIRTCPDGWEVARNVTDAIRIIATQKIEEISLDHDASHGFHSLCEIEKFDHEISCPNDFSGVAYFIGEKKLRMKYEYSRVATVYNDKNDSLIWNPKITVHSANPDGARRIKDILNDYGIISRLIDYSELCLKES